MDQTEDWTPILDRFNRLEWRRKIDGVSNMSFIDGDFKDSMQASEFCGCLVLADYGDLADELLNLSMFSFF